MMPVATGARGGGGKGAGGGGVVPPGVAGVPLEPMVAPLKPALRPVALTVEVEAALPFVPEARPAPCPDPGDAGQFFSEEALHRGLRIVEDAPVGFAGEGVDLLLAKEADVVGLFEGFHRRRDRVGNLHWR